MYAGAHGCILFMDIPSLYVKVSLDVIHGHPPPCQSIHGCCYTWLSHGCSSPPHVKVSVDVAHGYPCIIHGCPHVKVSMDVTHGYPWIPIPPLPNPLSKYLWIAIIHSMSKYVDVTHNIIIHRCPPHPLAYTHQSIYRNNFTWAY